MPGSQQLIRSKLAARLLARKTLFVIYVVAALFAAGSKLLVRTPLDSGHLYPPLQNYAIFRDSWVHFIHHQDLYARYIQEYGSYYRYSPAFSLLIAPLAVLPYALGATIWTLLNALALFFAVWAVPGVRDTSKGYALWFALIPLIVSMQNAQSNALMAALMLAGWIAHERGRPVTGALAITSSVFIKLFGGLAALPCLLAAKRGKFIGATIGWGVLFTLLPLVVVSPSWLIFLYQSWRTNLQQDQASWSFGLDLPGLMRSLFHLPDANRYVVPIGLAILIAVLLLRRRAWHDRAFRLLALASVLVWVIIFNFRAESPSMIIAVTGVAIWYFFDPARQANESSALWTGPRDLSAWLNLLLLIGVFLFTEMATTDAVPRAARRHLNFYSEVDPVILVWFKMQYDLLRFRTGPQ